MKNVIAIVGPTASGKTALSIALAKHFDTQIIAMDSMQIYKHMDIGTAKPTTEEMEGIVHHMLDVVMPDEAYSVAQYKSDAVKCIDAICAMGKTPILVGGTGLYLRALSSNMHLGDTVGNDAVRKKFEQLAAQQGNQALHALLEKVDPLSARRLHPNDARRVVRALEVYELTGVKLSDREESAEQSDYAMTILGVSVERQQLIQRINLRVDNMIKSGLVEEVAALKAMGVQPHAQSMQGIGYKELLTLLNGASSIAEAIETIKIRTRQYAKRQMTWFRGTNDVHWLDGLQPDIIEQAIKICNT